MHPWVIANDRLKAEGWEPASSNEEAYVGAHRAGPWATLSPRRRQELALGAAGVAVLGGVAVGAAARLPPPPASVIEPALRVVLDGDLGLVVPAAAPVADHHDLARLVGPQRHHQV